MKPLHLTKAALADLEHALNYHVGYSVQSGDAFYADMARAFARIQSHPDAGSPRLGQELDLTGLRAWHLKKFNAWVVYYFNAKEVVSVVRIVHGSQQLQREMIQPSE